MGEWCKWVRLAWVHFPLFHSHFPHKFVDWDSIRWEKLISVGIKFDRWKWSTFTSFNGLDILESVADGRRIFKFLITNEVLNPLAEEPPQHDFLAEVKSTLLFLAFLHEMSLISLQLSLCWGTPSMFCLADWGWVWPSKHSSDFLSSDRSRASSWHCGIHRWCRSVWVWLGASSLRWPLRQPP